MSVTEEKRHHLYQRLEQVLGVEEATTMMELVPPVGWADVATKHDLGEVERRVSMKLENVELSIRSDLHRELKNHLLATLGLNLSMLAGAIALVRF